MAFVCNPANGQARKSLWIETASVTRPIIKNKGQARKSLWIETPTGILSLGPPSVRLVRACGSKPFAVKYWFAVAVVRLVRACGSKPVVHAGVNACPLVRLVRACGSKRLIFALYTGTAKSVRLVRACGSKQGEEGGNAA